MVVPPGGAHAAGIDVIGYDVAVVGEFFIADRTVPILDHSRLVQQFSHYSV